MEPRIIVDKNKIHINEFTLEFTYSIRKTIARDDKIFVLLSIPTGVELSFEELNNIFAVNLEAVVLWRVDNSYKSKPNDFPFEGMTMTEDNELRAFDFYGRNYLVNTDNGTVSDIKVFR